MGSSEETLQAIQKALGPYARPRDEVAHIRRVLALHLDSCLGDEPPTGPLALTNGATQVTCPAVSRGIQREYLEALQANIKARQEYDACCSKTNHRGNDAVTAVQETTPQVDRLHEHLAAIKYQKKRDRLQAVQRHLELLAQKPAASPDFLDPIEMFRDSKPLPHVPGDVVTALTLNASTPATTLLKDLIDQLEKHVLRAKLLLKREEQLLEQVKARSTVVPDAVPASGRLEALNATRNELINWIESELGKAGDSSGGGGGGSGIENGNNYLAGRGGGSLDVARPDDQLAEIKERYARYVAARKSLIQLVHQQPPRPVIQPPRRDSAKTTGQTAAGAGAAGRAPQPLTHLLAPYLEQLLSVAIEQKGLIAQKSHLNVVIAKQLKETCQAFDRLAEESQLIPAYPMPGAASRRKPANATFGDMLAAATATETLDTSSRVKPWVFAADSAKIATLETVAEKIEEGQVALEGSMRAVAETDRLLEPRHLAGQKEQGGDGNEGGGGGGGGGGVTEDDIWLAESRPRGKSIGARMQESRKRAKSSVANDIWSLLDGNLGLLGETDPL